MTAAWCARHRGRRRSTRAPRSRRAPRATASVARARFVVQVQMIDSSGTVSPPSAPGAEVGHAAVNLVGGDDLAAVVAVPFGLVLQARAARRVPRRSTRPAARRCARPGCRSVRRSRRAGRSRGRPAGIPSVPGLASKPVCRRAVLALLVPSPTSSRAFDAGSPTGSVPASARAIAEPTMPAPTTTTSQTSRRWVGHVVVVSFCVRTDAAACVHRARYSAARSADHVGFVGVVGRPRADRFGHVEAPGRGPAGRRRPRRAGWRARTGRPRPGCARGRPAPA